MDEFGFFLSWKSEGKVYYNYVRNVYYILLHLIYILVLKDLKYCVSLFTKLVFILFFRIDRSEAFKKELTDI